MEKCVSPTKNQHYSKVRNYSKTYTISEYSLLTNKNPFRVAQSIASLIFQNITCSSLCEDTKGGLHFQEVQPFFTVIFAKL